jgi:hypothetical protein
MAWSRGAPMGLITCEDCGHQISDQANACPQCEGGPGAGSGKWKSRVLAGCAQRLPCRPLPDRSLGRGCERNLRLTCNRSSLSSTLGNLCTSQVTYLCLRSESVSASVSMLFAQRFSAQVVARFRYRFRPRLGCGGYLCRGSLAAPTSWGGSGEDDAWALSQPSQLSFQLSRSGTRFAARH